MVRSGIIFGTIILGAFLLGAGYTHANVGLTIQPVKISQTLKPGGEVSGIILLSSASEEDVRVEMSIEDFIPVPGAEGIQFVGRAPGVTTVRDWISLKNGESFVFKKGEKLEIPYTIKAPEDAEPGSHFGVIFFKAVKLADENAEIKVGTQVGVLVFVTIPGNHLQKGAIHDFTAPTFVQGPLVPFTMRFENTGTVHFEPKGTITITNMFGKEVGIVPIEGQAVLPTGVKNLSFAWQPNGFIVGKYTAKASVFDGEGNELTSESLSFYAFPIWYAVIFLAVLIVIFGILKLIRKKVRFSIQLK